ncbi:MAG: hypothetical protein K5784_00640 [Clostridiales bacterium]|jgi:hypothetical protein|nr:hypothetical protein [Clostridiales bacterium]
MYHRQIRIQTENGPKLLELNISYDHEDPDEATKMIIKIRFEGKEITAAGEFEETYAYLQKQLPESVKLEGCVTCRHGNMCPIGDRIDEVFCTKDVSITCKSDLYFYTEDDDERKRRSRKYNDFCDDYAPQENGVFTYSDYLYYLDKE